MPMRHGGTFTKAALVLNAMVENGAISQKQAEAARQRPAVLHAHHETSPGSNYFVNTATTEVKSRFGSNTGDLTIQTTFDSQLQQIAERIIAKRLDKIGIAKNVHQAALIAMAPDGAILAMVGGRDYKESQFNRPRRRVDSPAHCSNSLIIWPPCEGALRQKQWLSTSQFRLAIGSRKIMGTATMDQ